MGPGQQGDTTGIWLVSIFGGKPRKLRDDAGRAAVSPDGARIAFVSGRQENEIWLMGPNGEDPRSLLRLSEGERVLQIQWSPDGQRLALMKARSGEAAADVVLESHDLSGSPGATILKDPRLRSFSWVAAGSLFYALQEKPPNEADTNLWRLHVDTKGAPGGSPQRITSWAGFSFWDLTATGDGEHLVFVKSGSQRDVYTAEFQPKSARLSTPRRLTLEERDDWPSGWSRDGRSILFTSDRQGKLAIFRQGLDQRQAEQVMASSTEQAAPQLSPDGTFILYWSFAKSAAEQPGTLELFRMPLAGGNPERVLGARSGSQFRCATAPATQCVLGEPSVDRKQLIFSAFDPQSGQPRELVRLDQDVSAQPSWDLSADGSRIAVVNFSATKSDCRIIPLRGGSASNLSVTGGHLETVAWGSSGAGLFVSGVWSRGNVILYLHLNGDTQELWRASTPFSALVPSPDGKMLAFAAASQNSNVWMLENF